MTRLGRPTPPPTFAGTGADQTFTGRSNQPADAPRGRRRQRYFVLLADSCGAGLGVRRGHAHAERNADLHRQLRHDVSGG